MTATRIHKQKWLVTLVDRGREITIEVEAATGVAARNEAHIWHPQGQILHVEHA